MNPNSVEDRIPFFSHDIPAYGDASQYQVWSQKVAYKHSANWEQIFVRSVTSLTPEDTSDAFSSQIIHHTQREKRSNIAATSQLMWTCTLG